METDPVAAVEGDLDGPSAPAAASGSRPPSLQVSVNEIEGDAPDERSTLLPGKPNSSDAVERDAAFLEREFQGLPWWRRPSVRLIHLTPPPLVQNSESRAD